MRCHTQHQEVDLSHGIFELGAMWGDEHGFVHGELWADDSGRAIVCTDYSDFQSEVRLTEENPGWILHSLKQHLDATGGIDLYEQVGEGRYRGADGKLSYSDVARRGYRLIGLEDRVFPSTQGEGSGAYLIMEGTTSFEFGGRTGRLEADFYLWQNRSKEGLVLLDFPPDEEWRGIIARQPFAQMVEAEFDLKRATIGLAFEDYDTSQGYYRRRTFALLSDYVSGTYISRTGEHAPRTYGEVKQEAIGLIQTELGLKQPESLYFHLDRDFKPELAPELELEP